MSFSTIALTISLFFPASAIVAEPIGATVGADAPPLRVEKWLKGTPVDLKDGKVHVVEFWATWCGPCKQNMPHLSEISRKFRGKAVVSAVSVMETAEDRDKTKPVPYVDRVARFVRSANAMMDYTVGMDTADGKVANDWFGGQAGIPLSYVIDQTGKVVWRGHPSLGLEEVVGLTVDGKLTPEALTAVSTKYRTMMTTAETLITAMRKAEAAKDYPAIVSTCNDIEQQAPIDADWVSPHKYAGLAHTDPKAAHTYALAILKRCRNSPIWLNSVANSILKNRELVPDDIPVALELARQAMKSTPDTDTERRSTLAWALAANGKWADAVREQTAVLDLYQKAPDGPNEKSVTEAQKRLDAYRQNALPSA